MIISDLAYLEFVEKISIVGGNPHSSQTKSNCLFESCAKEFFAA
jgi:hypothetical protein